MTKFFLFSFFIILIVSDLKAQDVTFGIKSGVTLSNVSTDFSQKGSLTSFHLGGFMEALYSEKIAVQPEILYSEQGFKFGDGDSNTTFKLSYINVPVMIKYYVVKDLYVEAGPQIGFLNTAKLILEQNENTTTQNVKDALRNNDLSLSFGAGFNIKNQFNIGARYNLGLTNFLNKELYPNLKNRVLQFSVGYMF
jgi:hypothetical protein